MVIRFIAVLFKPFQNLFLVFLIVESHQPHAHIIDRPDIKDTIYFHRVIYAHYKQIDGSGLERIDIGSIFVACEADVDALLCIGGIFLDQVIIISDDQ